MKKSDVFIGLVLSMILVSGCRIAIQPYGPPVVYPAPSHPPVIVVPPLPPIVGTPQWIPGHYESRCYARPGREVHCPRVWVPGHWE